MAYVEAVWHRHPRKLGSLHTQLRCKFCSVWAVLYTNIDCTECDLCGIMWHYLACNYVRLQPPLLCGVLRRNCECYTAISYYRPHLVDPVWLPARLWSMSCCALCYTNWSWCHLRVSLSCVQVFMTTTPLKRQQGWSSTSVPIQTTGRIVIKRDRVTVRN